jgi:glutamine synthetase
VYSERELQSRFAIFTENYVKTINVEARLTALMARTMILPAALKYQADVATAVNATKAAGVDNSRQLELLKSLTAAISSFQEGIDKLEHALGHHGNGDLLAHAKHFRDSVLPAMNQVRSIGDKLETVVADEYWPLPTYREMLFIK